MEYLLIACAILGFVSAWFTLLLGAEVTRLRGEVREAVDLYEDVMAWAKEEGKRLLQGQRGGEQSDDSGVDRAGGVE